MHCMHERSIAHVARRLVDDRSQELRIIISNQSVSSGVEGG